MITSSKQDSGYPSQYTCFKVDQIWLVMLKLDQYLSWTDLALEKYITRFNVSNVNWKAQADY